MNNSILGASNSLSLLKEIVNLKKEIAKLEQKVQSIDSGLANTYWLSDGTQIGENDNLNNYTIPGNYYCNTNVLASTLQNCPIECAFILKVELAAGVSYLCQTIREFVTGRTFYRMVADSNTWTEWRSAAMRSDLPNYDFAYTDVTMDVNAGLTEVPNITGMEYIPVILRANVAYDGISVYGRMHTNTWVIESNRAQNMTVRFFKYPT